VVLFSRKKQIGVQKFILKTVNNNCPELKSLLEGPRRDKRVNLTLVVLVVPYVDGKLLINDAFHTVTKEFSATGVGIVLDKQLSLDEVVLGFRWGQEMTYLHAKAKHLSPMGAGFYQLGLELTEVVPNSDYPQLEAFK